MCARACVRACVRMCVHVCVCGGGGGVRACVSVPMWISACVRLCARRCACLWAGWCRQFGQRNVTSQRHESKNVEDEGFQLQLFLRYFVICSPILFCSCCFSVCLQTPSVLEG